MNAPAVATYSSAPDVSHAYIHQAPLAVASAGPISYAAPAPISYAAPASISYAAPSVAIHSPSYGSSHQSVERSLGGAQSISHYSKAIDSAFSSVRKFDTRITNDALTVAHAPVSYAAPVVAKTYAAAPVLAKAVAPVAYSAGPAYAYSSAPAVSNAYIHQAQPLLAKAVAPVAYAAHAPVATYAAHAAPVAAYAAHAPIATYAAHSPVAYAHGPLVAKAVGAPVVAKAAIAYSPATVVAHTTFTGLGTAYEW